MLVEGAPQPHVEPASMCTHRGLGVRKLLLLLVEEHAPARHGHKASSVTELSVEGRLQSNAYSVAAFSHTTSGWLLEPM